MTSQRSISSFVVRFVQEIWQDEQRQPHIQWRGSIRHVQDDDELAFTDFSEAVAFMQRHLARLTMESTHDKGQTTQEKLLQESFKLWESFAAGYSGFLLDVMGRTLKQSEQVRSQIDQAATHALDAFLTPQTAQSNPFSVTLALLQSQIQQLTEQVTALEKAIEEEKAENK